MDYLITSHDYKKSYNAALAVEINSLGKRRLEEISGIIKINTSKIANL